MLGENVQEQILKNNAARLAKEAAAAQGAPPPTPQNGNGITGDSLAQTVPPAQPAQQSSSQSTENKASGSQPATTPPASSEPPAPQKKDEPVAQPSKTEGGDVSQPADSASSQKPEETIPKWDDDIPEQPSALTTEEKIDIKKISSALSLEANSESEFVKSVSERLERLKTLESTSNFEGVPDVLKQAIEVAKKGGDWLSFAGISTVDAATLQPVNVFEEEYERTQAYRFKNADGSIDYEKLDAEMDAIPVGVKAMQGEAIKAQMVHRQRQRQAQIVAEAAARSEKFQKSLAESTNQLAKLLPTDQFGIVIEPKHSSFLYEGISKGSLIKKHLGDIDPSILSKFDTNKLAKTLAIAEWGNRISEYRYKQGEVAGKKALLQDTQNVQIQTPSSLPSPEAPKEEVKPSSTQLLKDMNEANKPKNSL